MNVYEHTSLGSLYGYLTSLGLVLLAFWGLWAFFPTKRRRGNNPAAWLVLAIWVGFLGNGLNALYWRVFGDFALYMGWMSVHELRFYGNTIGDALWKGLAAVSIYLHFYARYSAIPQQEKSKWRPLLMGFYPDESHWAYKCLYFWRDRSSDQSDTPDNGRDAA